MLLYIHVKDFAIIDDVEVDFRDGLNILSGETGAGKSIIIGSINVALGGKVSTDIIRKGADYALVEVVFQTDDDYIIDRVRSYDLPVDNGEIIITRKIMKSRTTSRINGETCTLRIVKDIASLLIDIHGQHEHQALLYNDKQLEIVDQYAKDEIEDVKKQLAVEYKDYTAKKNKLAELTIDEDIRLREISFLEYEINEIQNANLKEGEDDLLSSEFKRLSNAKTIAESLGAVYDLLSDSVTSSAADNIGRASKYLAKTEEFDPHIKDLYGGLQDIESLLNDFNRDLSNYLSDIDTEDEGLEEIEKRLDLINHLKAKYGNTISDILGYLQEQEDKLEEYINYDKTIEKLKKEIKVKEEKVLSLSERLSSIRKGKASDLSKKLVESLEDLNFMDVKFDIKFNRMSDYSSNGFDQVEFIISTNPGEELKPLSEVASGGELSRIMLGIKTVLSDKDRIYTLIFDEIDAGISGRTAQKVSEKLSTIANNHQVLCITHLPQIAAMADTHFIIEKVTDGKSTATNIRRLNEEESVTEIARILGGAIITDTVIQSAREMKALANKTKKF
ncbi:MAG: DNA repair protein RecN [Clostridiales bacterium]|nr:DNA repair protein RecN [Clostridiales bacterium]